jgi:hypothetical protein
VEARIEKSRSKWLKRILLVLGTVVLLALASAVAFVVSLYQNASDRFVPHLDLHDSHLVTPTGPIPFEMADDPMTPGFASNQNLRVRARNDELEVLVTLFTSPSSGRHHVFFRNMPNPLTIDLVDQPSWYRLNAEPEIALNPTLPERYRSTPGSSARVDFDHPAPLARYDIRVSGGTLTPDRAEQIRAAENDLHHFHLPFTADERPYTVNLTFSVGVHSYKALLGAPGTP